MPSTNCRNRPGALTALAALALTTALAATLPAQGYTYRIRYTSATNTDSIMAALGAGGGGAAAGARGGGMAGMGGMFGGSSLVIARGYVLGDLGRIDITATTTGGGGGGGGGGRMAAVRIGGAGGGITTFGGAMGGSLQDQYFLFLDTNRVVTVNEDSKTFSISNMARGVPGVSGVVGSRDPIARTSVNDSLVTAFLAARRDSAAAGGDTSGRFTIARAGGAGGRGGGGGAGDGGGGRGGNLGNLAALAGMRGGANDVPLSGVTVSVETIAPAPGDTIDGYATRHYRIVSRYTAMAGAEPVDLESTLDVWAADLPFKLANPFDHSLTAGLGAESLRELQLRQQSALRQVKGTPLKMVMVTPLATTMGGMLSGRGGAATAAGGGGALTSALAGATTTTTFSVYNITPAPVDPSLFEIPAGYTSGRGGQ